MRILGFSKKWDKLNQPEFSTFRFERRDKDWRIGERVQIVYKPRRKGGGERLGIARISRKEPRSAVKLVPLNNIPPITDGEALADGFGAKTNRYGVYISPYFSMWEWLWDTYDIRRLINEPMNKLTLRWVSTY